jgi:hypothetical protein
MSSTRRFPAGRTRRCVGCGSPCSRQTTPARPRADRQVGTKSRRCPRRRPGRLRGPPFRRLDQRSCRPWHCLGSLRLRPTHPKSGRWKRRRSMRSCRRILNRPAVPNLRQCQSRRPRQWWRTRVRNRAIDLPWCSPSRGRRMHRRFRATRTVPRMDGFQSVGLPQSVSKRPLGSRNRSRTAVAQVAENGPSVGAEGHALAGYEHGGVRPGQRLLRVGWTDEPE